MGAVGHHATEQNGGPGPLPAELVLGATPVFKEPRLQGGHLFWLEQRPAERGRTTLQMRTRKGVELELTPQLDLRSRIHGYGGGVYSAAADTAVAVAEGGRSLWRLDLPGDHNSESPAGPMRLSPMEDSGESDREPPLYGDGLIDLARQRWIGICEQDGRDRLVTLPLTGGVPRVLWESPDFCGYAVLSPSGSHLAWLSWRQPCMPWDRSQLWLGRIDASGALQDARPIAGSAPGDDQAISVFQPLWAGPDLVVANDRSGWWNLELLANAEALSPAATPGWRPLLPLQAEFGMPQWVYGMRTTAWDGERLVAAACRDGRWELGALVPESEAPRDPDHPGHSSPAAVAAGCEGVPPPKGMAGPGHTRAAGATDATTPAASDGSGPESLVALQAATEPGATAAMTRTGDGPTSTPAAPEPRANAAASADAYGSRPASAPGGPLRWLPIPLPFDDLAALDSEAGKLVAIAGGPLDGSGLLELNLEDLGAENQAEAEGANVRWTHRPAAPGPLQPEQISRPEPLWFPGHGGLRTHAWYYPPRGGASAASPLLVRGHSGPTAMAHTGLSLAIQFWTSRGWGVVDVNYGGSTGFGRAYRERLDGGWGVVDVDDCLAAARAVLDSGRADPGRIAMEGSSASGFTVLAAMARGDALRAGAVRYPVTDLAALAESDHRFEARYSDALVGPWPGARTLYVERSPLRQVDRINAPLLFFHGLDDAVVPAQQSIAMVKRLKARGVPVELVLFEGEGHGFRDGVVQRQVLERTETFFRERFGLA